MDDIVKLIQSLGLPFAYDHFAPGAAPDPPFICYFTPETHPFAADGRIYLQVNLWNIELYTNQKDPKLEALLEEKLAAAEIFFEKSEVYIEHEHLFLVLYSFEMKGN
ncbi:hypothetical protein [Alloscardovia omnicolens]|uniref:hypothetical protein n=1 Tax=Alloscardovia omnicolens TaxID=419015 RepID=UPI003A5DACB9